MVSKHRSTTDFVEPDLPITPMLDMCFQLMAFFIFTFRPAPTEGQIAMSLPKVEGGANALPNIDNDQPDAFLVRVEAASNGTIAKITVTKKEDIETRPIDLGADLNAYLKEMKSRHETARGDKSKAKVSLEIQENLLQEYVVALLDVSLRAGFTNIAPVPLDPKKR